MEKAIEDVFDLMTKYHEYNRHHIEGWKTNDYFKVNKKVILPSYVEMGFGSVYRTSYYRYNEFKDIEKVMCYLSGKDYDKINSIEDKINKTQIGDSSKQDSEFFEFRCYKKGTLHIWFKDEWLWSEFNLRATKGKGWLK